MTPRRYALLQEGLKKLATSDRQFYEVLKEVLEESESTDFPEEDGWLLRIYALAERQYRDASHMNLEALADEWGILDEYKAQGKEAIDLGLRAMRNAALVGQTQAYVASQVKGILPGLLRAATSKD